MIVNAGSLQARKIGHGSRRNAMSSGLGHEQECSLCKAIMGGNRGHGSTMLRIPQGRQPSNTKMTNKRSDYKYYT
jgi:hypothetical protein